MIKSFCCKQIEAFFHSQRIPRFQPFESIAMRKLQQLHATCELEFLRIPPGNRLEALHGNRAGQYNIRINSQ
ncbi:type II toxin-antitoxin system RelE/ParE family toxin [Alcanivorax sp.]|uniref:type II toxin-antitoxin system RelE/ParE family toxin n=1 Tax=Alcanivorax sp. TaxID=1872427 RepID=UPI002590FD59|nr:type II toxin-antitoxin system RelE/ParE family toxin [Alcanivorax sp.]